MDDEDAFRDDVWIDALALAETLLNHDFVGGLAIQRAYTDARPLLAAFMAVVNELFGKADRAEVKRLLVVMRERGRQMPPLLDD